MTESRLLTTIEQPQRQGCRRVINLLGPALPPPTIGHQVELADGRKLGYAEFGDPTGTPVFFFHGMPGSRLFRHPDDSIPTELGVRLIVVDRPGIGLSDLKPKRKLIDWPDDVIGLADALQLDRFAVAGVSAGGPHTMACAYKIPHRLSGVALVSAAAPHRAPGVTEGMNPRIKSSFQTAGCGCLPWWSLLPAMIIYARTGRHQPEKIWQRMIDASPPVDQTLLREPAVKAVFLESLQETYRQGPNGHIFDALAIARDWGFHVKDITAPVQLWQGLADPQVPPAMGRYLAETIPTCHPHFIPDEGHLMMFKADIWRDILAGLVEG